MNTTYNPDIHHRHSIRLQEYDYSQEGFYFVTICVQKYVCLFGEIIDGKMCLSTIGGIVNGLWNEIKNHVPNVQLHEFVVMPNHIHGIIEIMNEGAIVGATHALPLRQSRFQNQGKNTLSSIVGSYKSAVSKHVHRLGFTKFTWQRNYYEHIIRDTDSHAQIAQYIINNPENWNNDKFYIV